MNANNLFRFCIRSFRAIPCTIRLRRCYSVQSKEMDLLQHLKTKIKFSGPITVSEYMRMVLTNPLSGYYMQKDVFGAKGDFITSPEISQMFGELLAIWCIHEWMAFGSPPEVKLIELGPGRGTLADDMLRTFSQLKKKGVSANFSLHLVEISPHMRKLQESKLLGVPLEMVQTPQIVNYDATSKQGRLHSETKTTKYGTPVTWYYDMRTVPKGFSFFIAHEFFDALPVHQFQVILNLCLGFLICS
ncbi:protein arginine methyltransferase NDUFAF7, mitochondrial-like [Lingula anatina]|uniref:Protein arginine methyltransferase NDUFAF7 n=1 Tax=Lingula anatina TaxID=7574 RepID=A0A1S3IRK4_LINAN|nr:protein arginine methyltransferase NDUFAF7, mitochondrial-like [Lingula anatina]|eukprot:XP_013400703.1 protein arginine methyltransferase NDUFAF7, mitochondrial-like [Lingula anatina]